MKSNVALQKTKQGWQFIDESELETFVWDNLEELFPLKPLARQLSIKGEICDILAIGENNQLAIIELKNTEDRYVINQVTRYYDNLISEKPLKENVDYNQEILLLAVCPSFHRHNLIDKKYSRLNLDLYTFSILCKNQEFYFTLGSIESENETKVIEIKYKEVNLQNQQNDNIAEPPRLLLDWLGVLINTELENLTKIRHQILSFDSRIEETVVNKSIIYASKYGKDKIRQCAEFCFDKKAKKILFFLWLMIPNRQNKTIVRMQIDTMDDYLTYWRYIPLKSGSISWEKLEYLSLDHTFYSLPGNSQKFRYMTGFNSMFKELPPDNITYLKGWHLIFKQSSNQQLIVDELKNIIHQALQIWLQRVN
jgi:RecB family endonuclease NucS